MTYINQGCKNPLSQAKIVESQ